MYYILDLDDKEELIKIARGKSVILTGRSVKYFKDVLNVAKEVILCEECSDGIEYDRKITYVGQAELIKNGDAKIIVTADTLSLHKVITYLSVITVSQEDPEAYNTDVGELWCTEKHLEMALIAVVEVIQKTIREIIDETDTLVDIHRGIREALNELDLICRGKKDFRQVCELIDNIRRLRAKAGLWRQKNRLTISPALKEDFRKITGNLAHAEDHLVQYLAQLKGDKCITCKEDQQT